MVPAEVTHELVIELYHQRTTEAQARQVEAGGGMALMNMANVVLRQGAALPSRWESYGYRAGAPGKIQVMLRTTPAVAEALVKKSGAGGLFVRSVTVSSTQLTPPTNLRVSVSVVACSVQ